MSDLATLHRLLVAQLARSAPDRLAAGVALSEIRDTILPYRRFRRHLDLHQEEDYDFLLLALAAGDDGLARLEDAALHGPFERERQSPNPDLTVLDRHGTATLLFDPAGVARALAAHDAAAAERAAAATTRELVMLEVDAPTAGDAAGSAATTPSVSAAAGTTDAPEPVLPAPEAAAPTPTATPAIPSAVPAPTPTASAALSPPAVPLAAAAPACAACHGALPLGRRVRFCPHCGTAQQVACPSCGTEAELGWKHCADCGAALNGR